MSLYEKMYDSTDRAPERPLDPPEEGAGLVCPVCGGRLYSSQAVRTESLFGDVLGCELCSEWRAVEALDTPPGEHPARWDDCQARWDDCQARWDDCPNCGEPLGHGAEVLLEGRGIMIACDACASDGLAACHCARDDDALGGLFGMGPAGVYEDAVGKAGVGKAGVGKAGVDEIDAAVLGTRSTVLGTRSTVLGTRSTVLGTRSTGLGTRSTVLGTRSTVLGAPAPATAQEDSYCESGRLLGLAHGAGRPDGGNKAG